MPLVRTKAFLLFNFITMATSLFNNKHIKEYAAFGGLAALFFVLSVWYYLSKPNYQASSVLSIGSILFMFIIMLYALRLVKRRPDYYSTWLMIIEGQLAVVISTVISVIGSFILCCIYIPDFFTIKAVDNNFHNNPGGQHVKYPYSVELIFIMAIIENYLVGAFISAIISYAVKPNQKRDETPNIFEEPAKPKIL
jgi:hypothetical protein